MAKLIRDLYLDADTGQVAVYEELDTDLETYKRYVNGAVVESRPLTEGEKAATSATGVTDADEYPRLRTAVVDKTSVTEADLAP